jgi:transcriptional regulator with XRE-family HTH domain
MSVRTNPTVRRRRLGSDLRRLRDAAGLTCEQAAMHLDCSASKISRLETARVPARAIDVQALCELYHATEEQTTVLVALARESRTEGWWQRFDGVMPDWFGTYIGLEAEAAAIRTYEIQLVPGLLQTEGYARVLFETADVGTAESIEARVAVRRSRQEILRGDTPPQYWAVLSEAVLHRLVGGPAIMRDQLLYLLEMSELRNVTIQVIRWDAGAHPGMGTPFVILSFPDRADPEVTFVEYLTGALYLEKQDEVAQYALSFNHLVAAAISPQQSVDLIRTMAKQLSY